MNKFFVLRTIRRERLRSALVLLLAGVPALLIGVGALVAPSIHKADNDFFRNEYGTAQVVARAGGPSDAINPATEISKTVQSLVPAGTTLLPVQLSARNFTVGSRHARATVRQLDIGDTHLRRVVHLERGRYPSAIGELLISPKVASQLHVTIGSTLEDHRVVGIARPRNAWTAKYVYSYPGTFTGASDSSLLITLPRSVQGTAAYQSLQDYSGRGIALNKDGTPLDGSTQLYLEFPADNLQNFYRTNAPRLTLALGALLVVALASLLVSTALRVTASKAILDLRLLHESGATRKSLVRLLAQQGLVLGASAGLAGSPRRATHRKSDSSSPAADRQSSA